jgi:hypothetical protein
MIISILTFKPVNDMIEIIGDFRFFNYLLTYSIFLTIICLLFRLTKRDFSTN